MVATTFLRSDGSFALPAGATLTSSNFLTKSTTADITQISTAYIDGPAVSQGSSGIWFACGTLTLTDPNTARTMNAILWDGTTIIDSGQTVNISAGNNVTISLSGFITNPAGNIRMSMSSAGATVSKILFNATGNSKDSTITAIRIG